MAGKLYADKGSLQLNRGTETVQQEGIKKPSKKEREDWLREVTLQSIGKPDDLFKIDIKELQDNNHYRINVYREVKCITGIVDSYYCVVNGNDVTSNPKMKKKYHDGDLALLSSSKFCK